MSFVKKIWKDRISQFPNRRTINDGYVTKQVTVGRDEGTVTEEGTPFDATEMNDLENRIYAAIEQGGGGGGGAGTYNYTELFNKPRINNHELNGNKSLGDLGIASNANELPIESGSATNTKDYIDSKTASSNYSINNLDFYRSGNVVFFNIITGTNSTDANGFIVSGGSNLVIRQGYRPPNNVNVLDTVSGNRMTCNADGTVWTGRTSQSGQSFRISACWITNNAFPT